MSLGQISRDGICPTFATYCTSYCIVDLSATPPITRNNYPPELRNTALRSGGISGPQDIIIPSWQRKLVWDEDNIDALVNTQSSMYGTVILSKGLNQTDSWILIDGLQRLAVGTAILNSLYDKVLAPEPNNQTAAPYFTTIKNQVRLLSPVFKWNHDLLLNHGRVGIKMSYKRLFDDVENYVEKRLNDNAEQFGMDVSRALLIKQIAIDPYSGFLNRSELIKTFLEINNTGEPLSKIDLLRAEFVSQMENLHFSYSLIDEIENNFTEVFQPEKNNAYYTTLGTQIYRIMFFADDSSQLGTQNAGTVIRGSDPSFIFPNWNSITKQDFDDFFEYIQKVWDITIEKQGNDSTKWKWPYLSEIAPYKLPFCMIIWFYYKNHYLQFLQLKHSFEEQKKLEIQSESMRVPLEELKNRINANEEINFDAAENQSKIIIQQIIVEHSEGIELKKELEIIENTPSPDTGRIDEINNMLLHFSNNEEEYPGLFDDLPDFLDGELETHSDILKFYRATVRKILDGNVGKTESTLHKIMRGSFTTLDEVSTDLNPDNAGEINDPPNENWLKGKLSTTSKKGGLPKLLFNACLLPLRGQPSTSREQFSPLIFKLGANFYNIDHLIPDSKADEKLRGFKEIQYMANLAPLEWAKNNAALITPCSLKLSTSHIYDEIKEKHPYCKWLVEEHLANHENDEKVYPISGTAVSDYNEDPNTKIHPFDSQVNLLEAHQNNIKYERISKLVEILSLRL